MLIIKKKKKNPQKKQLSWHMKMIGQSDVGPSVHLLSTGRPPVPRWSLYKGSVEKVPRDSWFPEPQIFTI